MRSKLLKTVFAFILCVCTLFLSACTYIQKRVYPLEYSDLIDKYSEENNIPPELLAAVIYTESKFDPDAVSAAGAVGLMQIMPSTAEEIALKMSIVYDGDTLSDPQINIMYGAYYLAYLYRNLGRNWDTACAAYNAGIGRVKSWLADAEYSDDGSTLKNIPISETADYVERINNYKSKYKKLYYSEREQV